MRRRRVIFGALACAVVVGAVVWLWPPEKEPEYQGKKLSEWLRAYRQPVGAMRPVVSSEAADAVRHIGTNGLPFLVRWIRNSRPTPRWRERAYSIPYAWNLKSRARGPMLELIAGRELRAGRAFWSFKILGEMASPAIPDLVQIAKAGEEGSAPSATAALAYLGKDALPPLLSLATNNGFKYVGDPLAAIGEMRYLGTNAHPAVIFLIQRLEDREKAVGAADILGRLALESELSVPALARCLQSTNQDLRLFAVKGLGKFGQEARGTVPDLIKILDDPAADVRIAGTNALLKIAPEMLDKR